MKRNNITKKDVSNKIYYNLGIPITFSAKILESILELIIDGLNKNKKVKISGFGTFKILNKSARIGRNPRTKEIYEIKERKTVVFHPSIQIKKRINDKR